MPVRVERLVTSGTFSLDGGTWDVNNNVWLIGDDSEVIVVDPAHDLAAIIGAINGRTVTTIVCTHGHNDHIGQAVALAEATSAQIVLHPDDLMLWNMVHGDTAPVAIADGDVLQVAGVDVRVIHTPGHSPGGVCLFIADLGTVLTGDTLFCGGPGATGRSYSDFSTILESILESLLSLPASTRVLTGHGDETTIGTEAAQYDAWVTRGH
jgi:glyoxylase-like metal-dependent hydrolase (beta-lactamase superfamily II)